MTAAVEVRGVSKTYPMGTERCVAVDDVSLAIAPGRLACAEARALLDQRFLSRDAPPLPLKNCGTPQCECRYEHYDDRRKGNRRAHDLGVSIDGYEGSEQRQKVKRGRRETDGRSG